MSVESVTKTERSSDELRRELLETQRHLDQAKAKVSGAKRQAAAHGRFSNPEWLTQQEDSVRRNGRLIGVLQLQLSQALRRERAEVLEFDPAAVRDIAYRMAAVIGMRLVPLDDDGRRDDDEEVSA